MPRARKRFYYRKSRKHWASHIDEVSMHVTATPSTPASLVHTIAENTADTTTPTPFLTKIGNVGIDVGIQLSTDNPPSNASTYNLSCGVIFVPQGVSYTTNNQIKTLIEYHPEYVMWLKQVIPQTKYGTGGWALDNVPSLKVQSRLKRNLNSGDKLIFFVLANTTEVSQELDIRVQGWARYYSRIAS